MEWINSDIKCPECNYNFCLSRENPNTGEKHCFCKRCGFGKDSVIKDGIVYAERIHNGIGILYFKKKDINTGIIGIRTSEDTPDNIKTWYNDNINELEDVGYSDKREGKWYIVSLSFAKEMEFKDSDHLVCGEKLVEPKKGKTIITGGWVKC